MLVTEKSSIPTGHRRLVRSSPTKASKPSKYKVPGLFFVRGSPITSIDIRHCKLLVNGADPGAFKKAQKAERQEREAHTFEAVAKLWLGVWKTGVTASTAENQEKRLWKHIMPAIGQIPVADVRACLASIK